jgi:hypothetical protein
MGTILFCYRVEYFERFYVWPDFASLTYYSLNIPLKSPLLGLDQAFGFFDGLVPGGKQVGNGLLLRERGEEDWKLF